MWRITLRGVAAHKGRYVLTALAVLLGVAFVAGTLVLTDTIGHTFDSLYNQVYRGTDAVVRAEQAFNPGTNFSNQRPLIDASLQTTVAEVPGVQATSLYIEGYAQLVGTNGKPLGHPVNGPPTLGEAWTDVPSLNPLRLVAGAAPRAATDVVIDQHSASVGHLHVGDRVVVLTKLPPATYTISGIATWGTASSPLGATITAFTPATAENVLAEPGRVNQIDVAGAPGVSQTQLAARLQGALRDPSIEVVTGKAVTAEGQNTVHQAFSFLNTFLLVFAAIALLVGCFLIFNTFSITVTQRVRELALLRAVGASRRQVSMMVAGESLVLGLVASAGGVVAGLGLAELLKAGMGLLGFVIPATGLVLLPRTVLVGLAVGTTVTVAAAYLPARRASQVAPVSAMQEAPTGSLLPSTRRARRGAILAALGAVVLLDATLSHPANQLLLVGLGASALMLGVNRLGPFFARPAARLIGAPFRRMGPSGELGRDNALRNPSRTYSTASALMVGVALVSVMTVLASSTKASVDAVVNRAVKADFVISSNATPGSSYGFSPTLAATVANLPQVDATTAVRSGVVKIYGTTTPVNAVDMTHAAQLFDVGVVQGHTSTMTPTGIAVSTTAADEHHLALGSAVPVTFPTTGTKLFTVQVIYTTRQLAGDFILTQPAAEANFPQQLDSQIYVGLAPGVTAAQGRRAIESVLAAYPIAKLLDQTQYKAQQAAQVDQLLNLIYGLLALAVLIALIGIANTLALSIHERTHELGLLRAIGLTRGQLRASIRAEALIMSLFGSVEGLVLGIVLGAALVTAQHAQGLTHLSVPLPQLLMVGAIAGAAGIVAAWRPSRRAARLNILRAVTTE
jgi:putative ABC transport system permease protein